MSLIEVARYYSYEEACEFQLDLTDAGINSRIEMIHTGISLMGGNSSMYVLEVSESDLEEALEITGQLQEEEAEEDHEDGDPENN